MTLSGIVVPQASTRGQPWHTAASRGQGLTGRPQALWRQSSASDSIIPVSLAPLAKEHAVINAHFSQLANASKLNGTQLQKLDSDVETPTVSAVLPGTVHRSQGRKPTRGEDAWVLSLRTAISSSKHGARGSFHSGKSTENLQNPQPTSFPLGPQWPGPGAAAHFHMKSCGQGMSCCDPWVLQF